MGSVYNISRSQWVVISLADHTVLLESMIAITEQSENCLKLGTGVRNIAYRLDLNLILENECTLHRQNF
jgi:hypothetical protein